MQALVNTAATLSYFSSVFLSAPLTSLMMSLSGMPSTYIMFALVNCTVFGIVFFLVPETGGRSYIQFKKEEQKRKEGTEEEEYDNILQI